MALVRFFVLIVTLSFINPPVLSSLTGKVRELVVSAGESVEVTLPRNAVELNAFVVPTPPEGKKNQSYYINCCLLFITSCQLN